MGTRKLGKKPARKSFTPRLADFFSLKDLPIPPAAFGNEAAVAEWHMLGNDQWGNCVWAGAAHLEYLWSLAGARPRVRITTADTFADYAAATGFAYTDATDNGTDMQAGAEYWRTVGIRDALAQRHRIDCHLALDAGNWYQMVLATYLFGGCGIGLNLPRSALAQNDAHVPWTVVPRSKIEGGHFVPAVCCHGNGNVGVVTWGTLQEMSQDFYEQYSDEARVYLSLEILNDAGLSPEGFAVADLRSYINRIGASHA